MRSEQGISCRMQQVLRNGQRATKKTRTLKRDTRAEQRKTSVIGGKPTANREQRVVGICKSRAEKKTEEQKKERLAKLPFRRKKGRPKCEEKST